MLIELEFKSNHSIISKTLKSIAIIIKHSLKCKKGKTYSFSCKNFT